MSSTDRTDWWKRKQSCRATGHRHLDRGRKNSCSNNTAIFRVAMHCSIVDASHSETLFPKRLIAAQISLSFKHPGANNRSSRPRFRDSRNRQLNPSPCWILRGSRLIASSKKTISISWLSFFFRWWTDTPDYVFLTIKLF